MKDYIELTKPRVTWLILMSTGIGYWFGAQSGLHWVVLLHAIIGTALIASGTFTLNQWYEREADGRMRRTQHRPLPTGRVTPRQAMIFGLMLSVAGFLSCTTAPTRSPRGWACSRRRVIWDFIPR